MFLKSLTGKLSVINATDYYGPVVHVFFSEAVYTWRIHPTSTCLPLNGQTSQRLRSMNSKMDHVPVTTKQQSPANFHRLNKQ